MSNRFDFEQALLSCWQITEDLDTVFAHVCDADRLDSDEIANVLLGLKQLYEIKFNRLFQMFEENVRERNFT